MKVAYVAGPYRSMVGPYGIMQNIRSAEAVAVELWKLGYAVICPHKNRAFFDGAADDAVWLEGDKEFVRRSDVVVMAPGWRASEGARAELVLAYDLKKPVMAWDSDHSREWLKEYAKEA